MVVFVAEAGEAVLLATSRGCGWDRGLLFEGAVHAFVSSILLGVGRLDEFGKDAQSDPPDRQPGEPGEGGGGSKGGAVVGTDDAGQAVFAEEPVENGLGELRLRGVECLAAQQEATVSIDDSERIAVFSIQGLELALEVGGPDMIGGTHGGFGFTGMSAPRLRPSGGHEAVSFEDVADGGTSGPGFVGLSSLEPVQ